jgi:SUKH-3 immunity protein
MKINYLARKNLMDAGWAEGRNIDISSYVDALIKDGYVVPEKCEAFLKEFGGLSGSMNKYASRGWVTLFHFDPIVAIGNVYRDRFSEYEDIFGESITLVGESDNNHLALGISKSGKFLGGFDDDIFIFGESIEDGLNTLFCGNPVKLND